MQLAPASRDGKQRVRSAFLRNRRIVAEIFVPGLDRTESVDEEISFLRRIDEVYGSVACDRHYVFGNHCIDTLTKEEFLENSGAVAPHYSFDEGEFHFVVLDSCYRSDGVPYGRNNAEWTDCNIPGEELDWLSDDLRASGRPTVVFAATLEAGNTSALDPRFVLQLACSLEEPDP